MDWFPLYNSIRIALIATAVTFFLGIFFAYYAARLPRALKGILDCILTLPLVMPPTVIGFFLLKTIGMNGAAGKLIFELTGSKITMTWYASILAVIIVTFPLMYRTARSSFEAFDRSLIYAGKTLGLSNTFIFWKILMPGCRDGLLCCHLPGGLASTELQAWFPVIHRVGRQLSPLQFISCGERATIPWPINGCL